MDMDLIWLAIGAILLAGILMATHNMRKALTFLLRGIAGGFAIWGINFLLTYLGIAIATPGINLLTITIAAFLGLPGIITIYSLNYFM
jgi:inhibitor of the pro-sigma K processing machinery